MTACHFVLSELETGHIVGHALLCPDARYCSVRWRRAERLDRRFVSGSAWAALGAELVAQDWPKGYVEGMSTIAVAIVPADHRRTLSVQHVSDPPIPEDGAAAALDDYLRAQVFP